MSIYFLLVDLYPFVWVKNFRIRLQIIGMLSLILLTACINLCIPIALKTVIDKLSHHHYYPSYIIYWSALTYGVLWITAQLGAQLRGMMFHKVISHNIRLLVLKLFEHLIHLPIKFHLNKKSGEILSALDKAQDAFPTLLDSLLMQIVPILFEISVAFTIICSLYGLECGIVLVATILVYLISVLLTIERSIIFQKNTNDKHFQFSSFLFDILQNFEAIKYFNNHDFEYKNCNHFLKQKEIATIQMFNKNYYLSMLQISIVGLGLTLMTLQASHGIKSGQLSIGDFILLNGYLLQFAIPMGFFGFVIQGLRQSLTDMQYVFDLLKQKSEIICDRKEKQDRKTSSFPLKFQRLEFENVSFNYENSHETNSNFLKNLSFNVQQGKTLAFVGKTGSGKSTITKLLFGFFEVNSGRILIDGIDLKEIHPKILQSVIGIVPQDIILFNRTLYENIAYANPEASREEVEKAIKLANLETFIQSLPYGLNTMIGERGVKLSGGEKQRISIARIFLKKPKIFVLDEATSSLDTKTAQLIQQNLSNISTGALSIVIAHQLSTVMHADEILVLEKGSIVERGTHHYLIQKNGAYAELWNKESIQQKKGVSDFIVRI